MKFPWFNDDRKKVFSLLFVIMFVMTAVSFAGRVSTDFFGADSLEPAAISVQPPPGAYELESEDDALYVSMFSMIGADVWYTDDGSNPVGWRVLDRDNPNLQIYPGHSIELKESTTFRVVGVTFVGFLTPVQTLRYNITIKQPEEEVDPLAHEASPEESAEEIVDEESSDPRSLSSVTSETRPTLADLHRLRAKLLKKRQEAKIKKRYSRAELIKAAQERRKLNGVEQHGS